MAADLGIASATVSRVYELLASDGWVTAAGRRGTVVHRRATTNDLQNEVDEAAEHLALLARQSGLEAAAVHRLLDRALGLS
jgi:DNA-binding transcriptional regulator YhcF (GntR family)